VKSFFFILAFAILYMSCLPCGDSQECNSKAEIKISASTDHEQHDHQSEACTPFCTCSCCPSSAVSSVFGKSQVDKLELSSRAKYALFDISFHSEPASHIWQPPKLS
jgi:hypothetical protein